MSQELARSLKILTLGFAMVSLELLDRGAITKTQLCNYLLKVLHADSSFADDQ